MAALDFSPSDISAYFAFRLPKLKQRGPEWRGRCPVHDGKRDSFAVDPVTGRSFCHSACDQGWDIIGLEQALLQIDFAAAKASVEEILHRAPKQRRIVAEYDYTDEAGKPIFQCVRFDPKDFRQRHQEAGGWVWNLKGCRLVLYHLPPLSHAEEVIIVEGEKDVEALESLGFVATCNPMGAKKWRPEYSEQLARKRCFQIVDQDESGFAHAVVVGTALAAAGIEHWLISLPLGKDAAEWIQAGGSAADLKALMRQAKRFDADLIASFQRVAETAQAKRQPDAAPAASDLTVEVEDAIARKDLAKIYQLIPAFAKLDQTSIAVWKIRLRQEFGRDYRTREWDEALRAERLKNRKTAGTADETGFPTIVCNNRPMRAVSLDALAALRASNDLDPQVFVHSGAMVRVMSDELGGVTIRTLNHDGLRGCLDRSANYVKSGDKGHFSVAPPLDVVKDIAELPADQWQLPRLVSVTSFPILRTDGSILYTPGYDARSGFFYAPRADFHLETVPDELYSDDVDAAVAVIDDAICDFPFADEPSRANYLALLLTPLLRPAIAGSVPLCIIEAPSPGSGKSLLVDLASVIITGRPAAMTPLPRHEDEFQKTVGAFLLEGQQMVCFDNVAGRLDSAALALLLTSKEFRARLLGATQVMVAPNLTTWVATGNNIATSDEIARRCYHIRVEYASSNPFLNRDYRHPQLLAWAAHNRAKLFYSLLVIARHWFLTGRVETVRRPLGSFESWHQLIGSILAQADVPGLLDNFRSFMVAADEDSLQWEAFLIKIKDHFDFSDVGTFTISELEKAIEENPSLRESQPDSILVMRKRNEALKVSLGRQFSQRKGRRYGEKAIHIHPAGQHNKVNVWAIEYAGEQKELF